MSEWTAGEWIMVGMLIILACLVANNFITGY